MVVVNTIAERRKKRNFTGTEFGNSAQNSAVIIEQKKQKNIVLNLTP